MVGLGQRILARTQEVGADVLAGKEVDEQRFALLLQQESPLAVGDRELPDYGALGRGLDPKTSGPGWTRENAAATITLA